MTEHHALTTRRPGVVPTIVRPATIVRLAWRDDQRPPETQRGRVDPTPVARTGSTTLHHATDVDGTPCYVLRGPAAAIVARHDELRFLATLTGTGVTAPTPQRLLEHELWLDRRPWLGPARRPNADTVARYVAGAVHAALHDGTVVGTGQPQTLADGTIGSVEVVVARQLEVDERHALATVWQALVLLDPVLLADATTRLCGARSVRVPAAAERAVLALVAEWTPVSLGLSLHHLACAAADTGPRAEPLVLLADELLHRLDLAHHTHTTVAALASPTRALHLTRPEASWA